MQDFTCYIEPESDLQEGIKRAIEETLLSHNLVEAKHKITVILHPHNKAEDKRRVRIFVEPVTE